MEIYKGISASKGIAIGNGFLLRDEIDFIEKKQVENSDNEIEKFLKARELSISQVDELKQKTIENVGEKEGEIFEIHKMMMQDLDYETNILDMIKNDKVNAGYAVFETKKAFFEMFANMDDSYMNERKADVVDISDRIIDNILGNSLNLGDDKSSKIYFAKDLTPSVTISLDKNSILGFVTKVGSYASHSAILARNLNIPAVVGLGEEFDKIDFNQTFIIDGIKGQIISCPDENTIKEYQDKIEFLKEEKERLDKYKFDPASTKDNIHIEVNANIGGVADAVSAVECGADGVGLFRSEFLYLQSNDFPSEEVQFESYKKVLETMGDKRVIVRTLDLGSDKQAPYFNIENEDNPALGYRAIRICLDKIEIFKTQLRALYRSSVYGNLSIMFPMIVSVKEILKVKEIIEQVKKELDDDKITYSKSVEIGVMIETPASVMISDKLAQQVDFFSVGTNDLTQYTMAADRMNANLANLFDSGDISIMRMIKMTVENANKNGIWVGICGESAANTEYLELYLSMGVNELSVSPPAIAKIKDSIRKINVSIIKKETLEEIE